MLIIQTGLRDRQLFSVAAFPFSLPSIFSFLPHFHFLFHITYVHRAYTQLLRIAVYLKQRFHSLTPSSGCCCCFLSFLSPFVQVKLLSCLTVAVLFHVSISITIDAFAIVVGR